VPTSLRSRAAETFWHTAVCHQTKIQSLENESVW
jgi:hypothetical protein